jgi:tetratricopeptide (TPR) repeat protein
MNEEAQAAKNSGNKYYSQKRYEEAIQEYMRAIYLIENNSIESQKNILIIQGNISACQLILGNYMKSLEYCNIILESNHRDLLEDTFVIKTLLRRIQSVLDASNELDIEWNLVKKDVQEAENLIQLVHSDKKQNFFELLKKVEEGISEGIFLSFPRVNFLKEIPNEVVFDHIMTYLQPKDLLMTSEVNRRLLSLSSSSVFWLNHCKLLWKDKIPRSKYELMKNPIPKSKTWKLEYFNSLKDSRRVKITMDELQNLKWIIVFKNTHMGQQIIDHPTFGKNGVYSSELFDHEFDYRLIEDGLAIQIAEFPFLSVDRTKDWGFHLENSYVDFYSQ